MSAGNNLAITAQRCGQLDAAIAGIVRLQGIYDLVADVKLSLLRDWLMADIERARRHPREAERLLHDVRDGFLEHGFSFEAALADLEMAKLAASTNRWSAATQLRSRGFRTLRAAAAP